MAGKPERAVDGLCPSRTPSFLFVFPFNLAMYTAGLVTIRLLCGILDTHSEKKGVFEMLSIAVKLENRYELGMMLPETQDHILACVYWPKMEARSQKLCG